MTTEGEESSRMDHEKFMLRALALAARGYPAPNPHVGCVIAHGNLSVGEGWHKYAGAPHAEAVALLQAGDAARGATAYVTLEPCAHTGRTPPCADALIASGIAAVFVSVRDPNPVAAGGAEKLRAAGIQVEIGLLEALGIAVNQQFLFAIQHKRPMVTLKAGVSLDARIALGSGESQWITNEKSRLEGHRLRAQCGAVLVGRRTVELDDPELTARFRGVRNQPLRVVLDPHAKLTGTERVFNDKAETFHITGNIVLAELCDHLYKNGVKGLLVEGGAITHSSFVRAGLADKLELFIGAKLIGKGPTWLDDFGLDKLSWAPKWKIDRTRTLGSDLQLSAHFLKGQTEP